jgi:hypothetical protein
MNNWTPQQLLEWLDSDNTDTVIFGLRKIQGDKDGDIDAVLARLAGLLRAEHTDVRWITANILSEQALRGRDIAVSVAALEALFDDGAAPSWSNGPTIFTVGHEAVSAVTQYYQHRRDGASLRRLIASGGLITKNVLYALRSKQTDGIEALIPLVLEQKSSENAQIRRAASCLLAHYYYYVERRWNAIADLIMSEDEAVRRGALGTLDNLAEEVADGREHDLKAIVPHLLGVFARKDAAFKATRVAVARIFVWFIVGTHAPSVESLIVNDIDIMSFSEVRSELRKIRRLGKKFAK